MRRRGADHLEAEHVVGPLHQPLLRRFPLKTIDDHDHARRVPDNPTSKPCRILVLHTPKETR